MIGAGAAGLYIVSARVINSLDEGNLHSAVGGEESGLLTVLFYHLRYVFQNELLGTGKAGVAGRIRSGGVYKLDAQLFALGLDFIAAACQGYLSHVAGEAVMHEGLAAHFIGLLSHEGALAYFVNGDGDVRTGGNVGGVLLGSAVDYQQILKIANLGYLINTGVGTGACLVDDDALYIGIGAVLVDNGDELLLLCHEVIGHSVMDDTVAVLFNHGGCGTVFFFVLGNGVGDDGDLAIGSSNSRFYGRLYVSRIPLELASGSCFSGALGGSSGSFGGSSGSFGGSSSSISSGLRAGRKGNCHDQNQHQSYKLLHVFSSS